MNQLPNLTCPLWAFLLEDLRLFEDLFGYVICLPCGHLMSQNPANVPESFQKHGWLEKHLSLNHVGDKSFVDQLGYLVGADDSLQSYAGTLSWHTGSETLRYLMCC